MPNMPIKVIQTSACSNIDYDDKKSSIVKLTGNNDWEITVSETIDRKPVINGRPLFNKSPISYQYIVK